jgi:hypothetical protein
MWRYPSKYQGTKQRFGVYQWPRELADVYPASLRMDRIPYCNKRNMLENMKLHNLCCSADVKELKSRSMRWAGFVALEEKGVPYKNTV